MIRVLLAAIVSAAVCGTAAAATPAQAYADSLCQAVAVLWNTDAPPGYRLDAFRCKPGKRVDGVQAYLVYCTQLHGLARADFAVLVDPAGIPFRAVLLRRYRAGPVA